LEANAVTKNFDHPRYATNRMIMYSYAAPRLTDLARQGKLFAFSRGVQEIGQLFQVSPGRLALNWGIKPLLPKAALRAVRRLRGGSRKSQPGPSYVASEFASSSLYQKYLQVAPAYSPPARQNGRAFHYQHLNLGMLPYSLELINRLAAAFSVDVRFPFCDRNLAAFALSIPPEMKLKGGWSRYILRRAMSGILPEKVQWRGGKISLAKVYPYMLQRYAREYVNDVLENPPTLLERYLNLHAVRAIYQRFLKEKNTCDLEWVWHTVVFSVWMKQNSSMAG
jgi:asparagine synthase (glutamine-hydrolysing)